MAVVKRARSRRLAFVSAVSWPTRKEYRVFEPGSRATTFPEGQFLVKSWTEIDFSIFSRVGLGGTNGDRPRGKIEVSSPVQGTRLTNPKAGPGETCDQGAHEPVG